jgi:hypothetical protein
MYFDDAVVIVTNFSLFLRLPLAVVWLLSLPYI